jgi:oligopeptide transport system substrate-binding protein
MVVEGNYTGIADYSFLPLYVDPNPFLDPFLTNGVGNPTGWTDAGYSSMLQNANRTIEVQERMTKLAACERRLLASMPVLPMYFEGWQYLCKPFVRGLTSNVFDTRAFKYAWIDANWSGA